MTINKARKALNEACIGWFHENCYLVGGDFSGVGNEHFLCCWEGSLPPLSPHLQGFSQTIGLGQQPR